MCAMTTQFEYESNYLTLSMAIANLHYNVDQNEIIDSYRSWYKRCSDALKTMRYEGGNGVTHADVLFGDNLSHSLQDERSGSATGSYKQIGFGVVHSADSIAGTPNIHPSFGDSLNRAATGAFAAYTNLADDYDGLSPEMARISGNNGMSPSPVSVSPHGSRSKPQTSPSGKRVVSPNDSEEKNKTITWISGRLDRKYTFV